MTAKQLDILLLFDLSRPIKPEEYKEYLKTDDWKSEGDVMRSLERQGHTVRLFGLHDDIQPLIDEVKARPPDLVFNLSEAFDGNRDLEANVVALLEMLKIKHTGSGPMSLQLCKDKGLTKKILSYHRLTVPNFLVSRVAQPLRSLKRFHFPAFIKPLQLEASEGISQVSFAESEKDAIDRVKFVNERLDVDAIIEEYIEGRELYVGILGNERLTVFPPRELFFKAVPEGEPKFATFRAKWDDAYRKKWGIDTGPAAAIPEPVLKKLEETCKKIYRLLELKGYARIDLRLRPEGEVVFIEANPNPSIAREDDFAKSANKAGLDYDTLIGRIVSLATG